MREIHKNIRDCRLKNLKEGLPYNRKTEVYALKLAEKAKKKQPKGVVLPVFAFDFLQREKAFESTMSQCFDYAREEESEGKIDALNESIKEGEDNSKGKPWLKAEVFHIASKHDDCAEDHYDYQGKLYYDRFWRRYVKDPQGRQAVLSLISQKGMKSIQWVIGRPVWFITRPNCRHYFSRVTIGEALEGSEETILASRGMHIAVGERDSAQTIHHSTNEGWYTKENVQNIIKKYKERLAYHEKLYAKCPSEKLKGYIDKDKRLIQKWTSYLRSNF